MHASIHHTGAHPRATCCIGGQTACTRRYYSNVRVARMQQSAYWLASLQAAAQATGRSMAMAAMMRDAAEGKGPFKPVVRSRVACKVTSGDTGAAAGPEQLDPELEADFEELVERTEDAGVRKVLKRNKVKLVKEEVTSEKALQGLTQEELIVYGLSKAAAVALKVAFPSPTTAGLATNKAATSDVAVRSQAVTQPTDQTQVWLRKLLGRHAVVPASDALEEYLFQGLDDPSTRTRLPVPDGKYAALVAEEPDLQDWLEPASQTGADGVAGVFFTALMQREWMQPGSELNLAGMVDQVLYRVMEAVVWHLGGVNWVNRRDKTESSLTLPDLRPDFLLLALTSDDTSMIGMVPRLIMKGEDKSYENLLGLAVRELAAKMRAWAAVYFGKVPYLPCYAAAGLALQFCCLPSSGRAQGEAVRVGPQLNLRTRVGRCTAIHVALRLVPVLMGITQLLPTDSAPLAAKRFYPPATTIEYSTDFVVKSIDLNQSQLVRGGFDAAQANFMQQVYDAAAECPHLIHAQSSVHVRHGLYEVGLTPVGYPLRDEYAPEKELLLEAVRCILFALVWLHAAGIGHGDLRWSNIIQRMHRQESSDDGTSDVAAGGPEVGTQAAAAAEDEEELPGSYDFELGAPLHAAFAIIPPGLHAAAQCPGKYFVADLEAAVRLGTYQPKERVGARQAWDQGAALDSKSYFTEKSDLYMLGRMMQKAGVKKKDGNAYTFMHELLTKQLTLKQALEHPYVQPAANPRKPRP